MGKLTTMFHQCHSQHLNLDIPDPKAIVFLWANLERQKVREIECQGIELGRWGKTGVALVRNQSKSIKVETKTLLRTKMEDLTSFLKYSKRRQNVFLKNGFQDTGLQTVQDSDPWEMGNKKGEPHICLSLLPGEGFQIHREREPRWSPADSLSWGEFREVRVGRRCRMECQRGVRTTEICQRSPWIFSWMLFNRCKFRIEGTSSV